MSKRRYNSVEFKRVDWDKVGEQMRGSRVVFAVDVAKENFVATLLDAEQRALVTLKWRHPGETLEVLDHIGRLGQCCQVEAVMEPSGSYGDALAWRLREAGIALYRVAPKRVHDAAEVFDGVPSLHDAKAASLIGRLHLQGASQPWPAPSPQRRELAPLIAQYGDAASVGADPQGAAALLRRSGRAGLSEQKIRALVASAAHSLGVPCVPTERALLQWLAEDVGQTHRQLRTLEHSLQRHVEHTPALSQMGQVSAAVMSAALGAPQEYPDAHSYLKAMGLNLKERSSGKHRGQLKITKRGPSAARLYLYFAALRLIAHEPTVRRWYALKTQRPGAVKQKTVIELMHKLAKALWHVARGQCFMPEKLFNLHALTQA